jgi:hypothetical protein
MIVVCLEFVVVQVERNSVIPLVVGEAVVALDGDCLPQLLCDWQSHSYLECGNRLECCLAGCVAGAEEVPAIAACIVLNISY